MFGLIKLIILLILLSGLVVYGGDIWDTVKEKITEFTNPKLQRANIFDSFKNNFSEIENKIKEVSDNIDNPDFDKKTKLGEIATLIGDSKNNLEQIENSDETLIEKTFETLNDLKEGAKTLIAGNTKNISNQCDLESN